MDEKSSTNVASRKEYIRQQSQSRSNSSSPQTMVKTYSTRIEKRGEIQNSAEVACSYKSSSPIQNFGGSRQIKSTRVETTGKHESVVGSGEWKQVMTTTVQSDRDLLLELSTFGFPPQAQQQNIPMIELVVAVQSAIKHRQNIIDEWKKRAEDLTFQLQDLSNEKNVMEKMCQEKESKIDLLQKRLQELTGQYGDLSIQTDDIHEDLASYRVECERLKSVYQCAMHELSDARQKITQFEEQKNRLENKLRLKEEQNEKSEQQLRIVEPELSTSREMIRHLQDRIGVAEAELVSLRQISQMEMSSQSEDQVSLSAYQNVLDRLKCSLVAFEDEKKKVLDIQDELQRLATLIDSLSNEKGDLCSLLSNLQADKQDLIDKNSQLESQLMHAQNQISHFKFISNEMEGDIKCLGEKLDKVLVVNKNLECELNDSQNHVKNLRKSLQESENDRATISSMLNDVKDELNQQKGVICNNELVIRNLRNERCVIDSKLKSQEDLERKRLQELNRMSAENETFRNENIELQAKCDIISKTLFVSEEEVKYLRVEVQDLVASMDQSKRDFQSRIEALQRHNFCKEEEWKDYMSREMAKLNDENQKELEKYYSELLASKSPQRDPMDSPIQLELSAANRCLEAEILMLKRELEHSNQQLQNSIVTAEEERRDILSKASDEQARLMEQLNLTKLNAAKISSEIESQIQRLTQRTYEDSSVISKLTAETKRLQALLDKTQKIDDEWEQTRSELIAERESLKADLGHSRNLLCITENVCDRLKSEMSDLKKTISEYAEMKESLHREIVNLQNLLGQKESQLEINLATLLQTRSQLSRAKEENNELQCRIDAQKVHCESVEENVRSLTQQIKSLNIALAEANQEKKDTGLKKEALYNEITQLKNKVAGLAQDSVVMSEKCQYTEKCLLDMQAAHGELKRKLNDTETALVQAQSDCKDITNRYVREVDAAQITGQQLARLQSEHSQLEQACRVKVAALEKEMTMQRDEVEHCRAVIAHTETRLGFLKNCLFVTEAAYIQSTKTLSELWQSVANCLLQDTIQVGENSQQFNLPSPFQLRGRIHSTSPCPSPISESGSPIVSASLGCNPIRPLCVDHEQCIEHCQRDTDMKDLMLTEQKLFKLRVLIKNFMERKAHLERSELLKDKEISQLRESISLLKDEYEEQMRKLNDRLNERTKCLELAECQLIETKMMLTSKEEYLKTVTAASKNSLQHIEKLESIICCLQREKLQFQKDLEFMTLKLGELEAQNLSLTSQLRESECRLSKIQIRNVSLEGDIENLKLSLQSVMSQQTDASDALVRQNSQRQELLDKLSQLQNELDSTTQELNEMKTLHSQSRFGIHSDDLCDGKGSCCLKSRCHHLHSCLADFELERQLLSERLEASQQAEHSARLMIVGLEETIKSLKHQMEINEIEQASLQGRVTQLQQAVYSSENSMTYQSVAQSSSQQHDYKNEFLKENIKKLQISISVYENEKATLERVVNQLKNENENLNRSLCRAKEQKLSVERELESFKHKACELQRLVVLREQDVEQMRRTVEYLRTQLRSAGDYKNDSGEETSPTSLQHASFKESASESHHVRQNNSSSQGSGSRVTAGVISCSSRISCHRESSNSALTKKIVTVSDKSLEPVYDEYHKSTYITSVVPPHAVSYDSPRSYTQKDSSSLCPKVLKADYSKSTVTQDNVHRPHAFESISKVSQSRMRSESPLSRSSIGSRSQSSYASESVSYHNEARIKKNFTPFIGANSTGSVYSVEDRKSCSSRSRSVSPVPISTSRRSTSPGNSSNQERTDLQYSRSTVIEGPSYGGSRVSSASSSVASLSASCVQAEGHLSVKSSNKSLDRRSASSTSDADSSLIIGEKLDGCDVETRIFSTELTSSADDLKSGQETSKPMNTSWTVYSNESPQNNIPIRTSSDDVSSFVRHEQRRLKTSSISSSDSAGSSSGSPLTKRSSSRSSISICTNLEYGPESVPVSDSGNQTVSYNVLSRRTASSASSPYSGSHKSRDSSDDVPKRTSSTSSSNSADSLGQSSTLV